MSRSPFPTTLEEVGHLTPLSPTDQALREKFTERILRKDWNEELHPRGHGGKFIGAGDSDGGVDIGPWRQAPVLEEADAVDLFETAMLEHMNMLADFGVASKWEGNEAELRNAAFVNVNNLQVQDADPAHAALLMDSAARFMATETQMHSLFDAFGSPTYLVATCDGDDGLPAPFTGVAGTFSEGPTVVYSTNMPTQLAGTSSGMPGFLAGGPNGDDSYMSDVLRHEYGHQVAAALFDDTQPGGHEYGYGLSGEELQATFIAKVSYFDGVGDKIMPDLPTEVSPYATVSPQEMWSELFATAMHPDYESVRSQYSSDVRDALDWVRGAVDPGWKPELPGQGMLV